MISAITPTSITLTVPTNLLNENGQLVTGSAFTYAYSGAASETSGSNTVTTTNTASIQVGQNVVGPGIPVGTTVTAITPGVSVTFSNNVTGSGAQTLSYFGGTQAISFGEANGFVTLSNTDANWNSNVVLNPSGVLGVGNVNGLGKGTLTINGGVISSTSTIANAPSYVANANFTLGVGGANSVNLGTGLMTLTDDITITMNTTSAATIGGITGNHSLNAVQAPGLVNGSLTLSAASSGAASLNVGDTPLLTTAAGTASTFLYRTIASTADGSATVTLPDTNGLVVGQQVTGTGIIGTATIVSLTATTVTLSGTVAAGSPNLTFAGVVGVAAPSPLSL